MSNADELSRKLAKLVAESEARQLERVETRTSEMGALNARLDRFHALTTAWLKDEILPRLKALSAVLPSGRPPRMGTSALAAFLDRESSDEFPASAELVVQFAHDPEVERAHCTVRARIIPVLMQYEKEGTIEIDLDEAETPRLVEFIDQRICRFAADYLRIREPDSPYQRDRQVTDPVCGMTFHRWEAATSVQHNRRTWFFCTDECRERFEADPDKYPV